MHLTICGLHDLEDYLNANRTKVGLKEEERLVSFETEEPQKMNVRTEDNIASISRNISELVLLSVKSGSANVSPKFLHGKLKSNAQ